MKRLLLLAVPVLVAGCGPTFDAPSLARSLGPTFANLYVRAQEQSGQTGARAHDLGVQTTCTRGGTDTVDTGPGEDWACLVTFRDVYAGQGQVRYEVTLKPTGCWIADGPPAVVGDQYLTDAAGRKRLNPLYAFEGCLRP